MRYAASTSFIQPKSRAPSLIPYATCMQQVLRSGLGSAVVVRGAAGLLRQLAGSDGVKAAVVAGGGLELINHALAVQARAPAALEQVCLIWEITLQSITP